MAAFALAGCRSRAATCGNCGERLRWVPGGHYWPGRYHGIIIKPDVGFLE